MEYRYPSDVIKENLRHISEWQAELDGDPRFSQGSKLALAEGVLRLRDLCVTLEKKYAGESAMVIRNPKQRARFLKFLAEFTKHVRDIGKGRKEIKGDPYPMLLNGLDCFIYDILEVMPKPPEEPKP